MDKSDVFRANIICDELINKMNINLSGLNVITELASGAYIFNLLLAVKSKANVFAIGKSSKYGNFIDNKEDFVKIINLLNINIENLTVFEDEIPEYIWRKADIITNSGFVRPIDEYKISLLKPTAVIPLMWETWEYRNGDLDLKTCQKKQIPVIGTSEKNRFINIFPYSGFMTLKLLFQLNIEIINLYIVLIGSGIVVEPIIQIFNQLNLNYKWISIERYEKLHLLLNEERIDCVICAEHIYHKELVGHNSSITFKDIYNKFPYIKWGHICGNIDVKDLKDSGISYFPNDIQPPGYMSYQAYFLGIRPVIELFAGGLKVGEIAAKARLKGLSIEETINKTIKYGIGQDFKGGFLNFVPG